MKNKIESKKTIKNEDVKNIPADEFDAVMKTILSAPPEPKKKTGKETKKV